MKRETLRCAQGILCAALFLAAGAARAVDGVIEINHTSATATGYPVTIATPGSYRLTGNLTPPLGIGGIVVTAPRVEIDLNGFSITGAGGAAVPGIMSLGVVSGLVVRNGNINGFSGAGVVLGTQSKLLQVRVAANGAGGVAAASACLIEDSVIIGNTGGIAVEAFGCKIENNVIEANIGGPGVLGDNNLIVHNRIVGNTGEGVLSPGGGTLIAQSTISDNGMDGIECGTSCTVTSNVIESNGGAGAILLGPGSNVMGNNVSFNVGPGLSIFPLSGYSNNTMAVNGGPEVVPAAHPTDAFDNICDGAAC